LAVCLLAVASSAIVSIAAQGSMFYLLGQMFMVSMIIAPKTGTFRGTLLPRRKALTVHLYAICLLTGTPSLFFGVFLSWILFRRLKCQSERVLIIKWIVKEACGRLGEGEVCQGAEGRRRKVVVGLDKPHLDVRNGRNV